MTPRNLLCASLVAGLLLAAPEAEARFGKRSRSSSSSKKESKPHEATAVGDEDSGGDDDDDSSSGGSRRGGGSALGFFLGLLLDSSPPPATYVAPEPVLVPDASVSAAPSSNPLTLRLGLDGGGVEGGGATLGLLLAVEGERMGFNARYTGLALPTEDGTAGEDRIGLLEANLSYALWTSPRGRWRLEAGVASASAPDVTFIGPGFATSLEACLVGSLDFEGRLQLVPLPYRQVDAQAGLALHLNPFVLRGGWRTLVLDDAGAVDGERHVDVLSGPYLGLALVF